MQYITVSDVHKYWPITNSCTVFRQSTAEVKRYRNWSISGHWSNTLIVSNTISHLRNEIIDMVLRYQSSQNRVLLPCSWEGAKYCDDVCLAACKPPKPHVAYRWRPLAAWQLQYRMLCTSSFVDDITFSHSCPYGASHVFLSCDGTQNSWDTHKILLNDREQMYDCDVSCALGESLLSMIALLPFDIGTRQLNRLTKIFILQLGLFPNYYGQSFIIIFFYPR